MLHSVGLGSLVACIPGNKDASDGGISTPDKAVTNGVTLEPVIEFTDADVQDAANRVRANAGVDKDGTIEWEVNRVYSKAATNHWGSRAFDTSSTKDWDQRYAAYWSEKFRTELLAALES